MPKIQSDRDDLVKWLLARKRAELKKEEDFYKRLYRHNLYEYNGYLYRTNENLQRH